MIVSPYGSWASPIASDLVVADAIRFGEIALDGDAIYWTELQPQKQGRTFVYRMVRGGEAERVTPDDDHLFNVRTRAHEYGGGAFTVHGGVVYFSNYADQRLYARPPDRCPGRSRRLRSSGPKDTLRYADGVIDERRGRLICVREDHDRPGEAANTLVGVGLAGASGAEVLDLGRRLLFDAAFEPRGERLAWLAWSHPYMPWVSTQLWVGEVLASGAIRNPRRVAGGPDELVFQPEWSPDGDLVFVSDRTGWWNLYRERDGAVEALGPMEAEFGRPQWLFGMSTYAFEFPGRLIASFVRDGVWSLAVLDLGAKRLERIPTEFTAISQVRAAPGRAVFIGAAASEAAALVEFDLSDGRSRVIRRSFELNESLRRYVSLPESIAFPTEGGETAHPLYPPFSPDFAAPEGEKAPALVLSHGGPTSSASSALSLETQYWTSRGVGVLDVNYRGSTGYGRGYRAKLEGRWGVADVQDCVAGARWLVERRNADPARLMIAGGSAGGYTTLCALTAGGEKTFAAGASHYGVSDLAALARDTHKFESRYLDWLIGPYPQEEQLYADRSPINHIDGLSAPVIFFQGSDDRVVPPNQTELMVEALKTNGDCGRIFPVRWRTPWLPQGGDH